MAKQPNMVCESCGGILSFTYKYCPFCGTECSEEKKFYFSRGYTYKVIVLLLEKEHGIGMLERTLRNRLKQYFLKRRSIDYDLASVHERIRTELNGPGCMGGYRSVCHTIRMEGIQVPRKIAEEIIRELDLEGCAIRRAKKLQRRQYRSPGPDHCWHIDSYNKLKPYGFPVHGCIDGWSRKMLWLKLVRSNNAP